MSNRVTYGQYGGDFEVHIAAKRRFGEFYILPVWLVAWTFGGVFVAYMVIKARGSGAVFFIPWLIFWALFEVYTMNMWLWQVFGEEIVTIGAGRLTVKRSILGMGRKKSFSIDSISSLRAAGFFGDLGNPGLKVSLGMAGGTVAFEHNGTTQRFGVALSEKEAKEVVERIGAYLPETATAKSA